MNNIIEYKTFNDLEIGDRYYIGKFAMSGILYVNLEFTVLNKTKNMLKIISTKNDILWVNLNYKFESVVDKINQKDYTYDCN